MGNTAGRSCNGRSVALDEVISSSVETVTVVCTTGILILSISHWLHRLLKRLAVPRAISQVITGVLLGPTLWSPTSFMRRFFLSNRTELYTMIVGDLSRYCFMFLIGLEMDIAHALRTKRIVAWIAVAGMLPGAVIAGGCVLVIRRSFHIAGWELWIFLTAILGSTGSALIVRLCAEMKLATSETGQLAVSSALVTEVTGAVVLGFLSARLQHERSSVMIEILWHILHLVALVIALLVSGYLFRGAVKLMNRLPPRRQTLKNTEMIWIFIVLMGIGSLIETIGFSAMLACLFMGLYFPRDGRAARTIVDKLVDPVHDIVLPVYFGFTGMQVDLTVLKNPHELWAVLSIVVMSLVGKVGAVLAAASFLKMTSTEGLVLGFLLHAKGHLSFLLLLLGQQAQLWDQHAYTAMVAVIVLCNLVAGPGVAFIIQRQHRSLQLHCEALEFAKQDSGLRILACLYSKRNTATILSIIEALRGGEDGLLTISLMHLIKLTESMVTNSLLFHQQSEEEEACSELGGKDTEHISDRVDAFIKNTDLPVRLLKVCSEYESMYHDICNAAEDMRASMVILPFHKYRRLDGSTETTKEGYRINNSKVLKHLRCTTAILVDHNQVEMLKVSASEVTQNVVVIFLGGPDDREAAAYAGRIAELPAASLTMVRFLSSSNNQYNTRFHMESNKKDEVIVPISRIDRENEADRAFLHQFFQRYVESGKASYVEKFVSSSAEVISELSALEGMFSLYIVGKGEHHMSPLAIGMNEHECQELGIIGDILASSRFLTRGLILVIRQCRTLRRDGGVDECSTS